MGTTNLLRAEHALISKKLALIEAALQTGPEGRTALRQLCPSLLRRLVQHVHREADALAIYSKRIPSGRYLMELDHAGEERLLRGVTTLLSSGTRASASLVTLRLTQAIERLEQQMARQEEVVFPLVDEESGTRRAAAIEESISPSMSVNEILHRYPQTEPVFERLHINRLWEGYESVDELAWGHGMDVSQVIEELRQVVAFPSY